MYFKLISVYIYILSLNCIFLANGKSFKEFDNTIMGLKKRDMENDERALGVQVTDRDGKYIGGFNPDCSETLFITPSRKVVKVEPDQDILQTPKTRCHWNVLGTENCIPVLACKKFKLTASPAGAAEPCKDEFFEVTDGSGGYERFCGTDGPMELTTDKKLRDLYITFQAGTSVKAPARGFKCTVTCSEGKSGKVLKSNFEPESNQACNCGRKPNGNRIVGGEDAVRGISLDSGSGLFQNEKAILWGNTHFRSDRIVITAAHCFKGPYVKKENFQILMNGHYMDLTSASVAKGEGRTAAANEAQILQADAQENAVRFDVDKYFIHPLYVRQTNDYDVALIKLKTPVDFKKYNFIQPACMPNLATYNLTYEGVAATVAGWGLNSSDSSVTMGTLQKLDVKVFDATTCRSFFDERITRRMMCAGFKEGGKDSCKGDSGGPLISEKKKQLWHLIGLVSWGEGCAANNSPGVYLRVSEVNQWVRYISNMEDAVWCVE